MRKLRDNTQRGHASGCNENPAGVDHPVAMKKPTKKRARNRRRSTRRKPLVAGRRAALRGRGAPEGSALLTIATGDSFHGHDDDCPWCRAQRELGIRDGTPLDEGTLAAFQARVQEIIQAEGMPEGAITMNSDELRAQVDWVNARLAAEGRETDLDRVPDSEFAEHMSRVSELMGEYEMRN